MYVCVSVCRYVYVGVCTVDLYPHGRSGEKSVTCKEKSKMQCTKNSRVTPGPRGHVKTEDRCSSITRGNHSVLLCVVGCCDGEG